MSQFKFDRDEAAAGPSKILKGDDFAALDHAKQGIDAAHNQAQEIVQNAIEERENIIAAAHEQAKVDASELVGEFLGRMQQDVARREAVMTDIVLDSIRRLVEPLPKPDLIAALVRRAMNDIDVGADARLAVAPHQVQAVRERLAQSGFQEEVLRVQGNPDCAEDGCTLHCAFGDIELGLPIQLTALEHGLIASRHQDLDE